jgi:hypothetical protein
VTDSSALPPVITDSEESPFVVFLANFYQFWGIAVCSISSHEQPSAALQIHPHFGTSRCRWWEPSTASKAVIQRFKNDTHSSHIANPMKEAIHYLKNKSC